MYQDGDNDPPPESQQLLVNNQHLQNVSNLGENIEGRMGQMGCGFKTVFAVAACAVITCAVLSFLTSLATLEFPSMVDDIFLCLFGFLILIYNNPCRIPIFSQYQGFIRTYVRFLSRVSGQAIFFLFLGAMCVTALWPSKEYSGASVLEIVGVSCGLFVLLVALIGGAIALAKSTKLEKVREAVRQQYKGSYQEAFHAYCNPNPSVGGIGQGEFVRMSAENSGTQWASGDELSLIFNSLCDYQSDVVREHEFARWMTGAWTVV
eukprot:Platyproteum_vivax@DN2447_c0_g1_i1.p1